VPAPPLDEHGLEAVRQPERAAAVAQGVRVVVGDAGVAASEREPVADGALAEALEDPPLARAVLERAEGGQLVEQLLCTGNQRWPALRRFLP
jgi:hypothetical protein